MLGRHHLSRAAGVGAAAAAVLAAVSASQAASPPAPVERHAILEAVRPAAEAALGGPVVFTVKEIRQDGRFAFAGVKALRPGGAPYRIQRPDWMDAYGEAVLVKKLGRWTFLEWRLGPTDVWQCSWAATIPHDVLGPYC